MPPLVAVGALDFTQISSVLCLGAASLALFGFGLAGFGLVLRTRRV